MHARAGCVGFASTGEPEADPRLWTKVQLAGTTTLVNADELGDTDQKVFTTYMASDIHKAILQNMVLDRGAAAAEPKSRPGTSSMPPGGSMHMPGGSMHMAPTSQVNRQVCVCVWCVCVCV